MALVNGPQFLYEKSIYVDLKLETAGGNIFCHKIIICSRIPSCWQLISEIGKLQNIKAKCKNSTLILSLSSVRYGFLHKLIRSLYTNEINTEAVSTFRVLLQQQLNALKSHPSISKAKLDFYFEKLHQDEETEIQTLLFDQLKSGEISEEKGNLTYISDCYSDLSEDENDFIVQNFLTKSVVSDLNGSGAYSESNDTVQCVLQNSTLKNCAKNRRIIKNNFKSGEISYSIMNSDNFVNEQSKDLNISKSGENETNANSVLCEGGKKLNKNDNIEFTEDKYKTFVKCSGKYSVSDIDSSIDDIAIGKTGVKVKIQQHSAKNKKSASGNLIDLTNQVISPPNLDKNASEEDIQKGSQDGDLSDSEQAGFHETSSLEVELPSSQDEQSLSSDSAKSANTNKSDDDPNKSNSEVNIIESDSLSDNLTKGLVRTRTFDLIERRSKCSNVHDENRLVEIEDSGSTPTIIDGCIAKKSLKLDSQKSKDEDPNKLRELERLKGSLIFEHNLQTFSNIPTTNLMTSSGITMASKPENTNEDMKAIYNSMIEQSSNLGFQNEMVKKSVIASGSDVSFSPIRPAASFANKTCAPPFLHQKSHEEMAIELHNEIANRAPDTRSPSPDSLSLDLPPDSITSAVNKEACFFEEKEKDERAIMTSSSYSENKNYFGFIGRDSMSLSMHSDSPSKTRNTEDMPIVTGTMTTWKESAKSCLKEGSLPPHQYKKQTSISSVKDIDLIPVVSGYISPPEQKEDIDQEKKRKNEDAKQNIFSMFINLDEIKTPEEETVKSKTEHSGGVYMFIGADLEQSPKVKRKGRTNSESDKGITSSEKSDTKSHQRCENDNIEIVNKNYKQEETVASTEELIDMNQHTSNINKSSDNKFFVFIDQNEGYQSIKTNSKTVENHKLKTKNNQNIIHKRSRTTSTSEKDDQLLNNLNRERCIKESFMNIEKNNSDKSFFVSLEPENTSLDLNNTEDKIENESKGNSTKSSEKSFFIFIDDSKDSCQKLKKKPVKLFQNRSKDRNSCMSKSAPSDSHLFKTCASPKISTPGKQMTKSAIGREEFISQQMTRRNVSLSDKINESSKIPRPVSNFKEKLLESQKDIDKLKRPHKRKSETSKEPSGVESLDKPSSLSVSVSELSTSEHTVDIENASELSDISSLLSSLERSNEISDQDCKKNLGDDLLNMLINEINTDVTIQIGEKKIGAHKCILASRCVYFAAMLSGHWVESAGNVIKLQGFSSEAVMEALKHIYSGTTTIPDDINVKELAALADMLALDGLKDVVTLHYKSKICHYFHKPCDECLTGVLDVLPIAAAFCLDELYHKCLKWIAKHFVLVFPTRNFASLPLDMHERCLKQLMDDMSVSNVLDVAMEGERVISSLPVVHWAQPVLDLMAQLIEAATGFIAGNMSAVLASESFLKQGKDGEWNMEIFEDTLRMACESIRPDQAVLSHIQLTKLTECLQDETHTEYSEDFLRLCEKLLKQMEKFMIHNSNRVAVCRKWPLLPPDTQKRIKDAALIVLEFTKPFTHVPNLTPLPKPRALAPVSRVRASSMSDNRMNKSNANITPKENSVNQLQLKSGRSHTPPAPIMRSSLQTPPPTRTTTLRAQARQNAVQRSQSAKVIPEKLKKHKPSAIIGSDDLTSSNSAFLRGGTFTRSLSKPEQTKSKVPNQAFMETFKGNAPPVGGGGSRAKSTSPFAKDMRLAIHDEQSFSNNYTYEKDSDKFVHSNSPGEDFRLRHLKETSDCVQQNRLQTNNENNHHVRISPKDRKTRIPLRENHQPTDRGRQSNKDAKGPSDVPLGLGCRSGEEPKATLPTKLLQSTRSSKRVSNNYKA